MIDKEDVLREILKRLEVDRESAEQSRKSAHDAMVEAPGPMQSHSDTTRFQKGVLIDQYSGLIAEKSQAISIVRFLLESLGNKILDRVQAGAAIGLKTHDGTPEFYFMIPYAAGILIRRDGKNFTTLTPTSPLGAALLNKRVGDEIELRTDSSVRTLTVTSID